LRTLGADVHVLENRRPFDVRRTLARWFPDGARWAILFNPLQKAVNFGWFFLRPALMGAMFLRRNAVKLVHLNNSSSGNHEWMLASLIAGVPYVSHERGVSERRSWSSKWLGGAADAVICISNSIRTTLVGQCLEQEKAVVVYNGIDTEQVRPTLDPAQVRSSHGIGPDDPVIGVVGNIKRWKGQDTVVRATAILKARWPSVRCLLVGAAGGDPSYDATLGALVDELALAENVLFTGFQDNAADYINAMDVVVHASHEPEPFGRVNIEAMHLGKPVVSTDVGGPTEIFENGEDGILIRPADPVLLAQHLAMLLESPELRKRLGENARRSVTRKFTIAQTIRGVESVYERVLAR